MRKVGSLLLVFAACVAEAAPPRQYPLVAGKEALGKSTEDAPSTRQELHGRFLHITGTHPRAKELKFILRGKPMLILRIDVHPDPFYKAHSSAEEEAACHRGVGSAGVLGAETTDCDSPLSLVNETFKWIDANLKDSIDFVIWTGDSARHDNDEKIPRTEKQVIGLNELLVSKFVEVFGKEDHINDTDPTNDFTIPIVPTFGNNDILPHNIFTKGPNRWTKRFTSIWNKFIPEEQRHSFERGGWFYVEVIPNRLAVFSLNTLYFFDSNTAVDGCADQSEPGYEQMEWLRIQLQFLRDRGMKAIMMGHVPPARTESKRSWDETCWQKYTLWMRQYRDVVVGSLYGHMNLDHFLLQDSKDIDLNVMNGVVDEAGFSMTFDDEFTVQSSADYLTELRAEWSELPGPPSSVSLWAAGEDRFDMAPDFDKANTYNNKESKKNKKGREKRKYFRKIGGKWAERYSATLVSPSVIPEYFPTLRVFHYNITGLEHESNLKRPPSAETDARMIELEGLDQPDETDSISNARIGKSTSKKDKRKRKKNKKKHKKPKGPRFVVPTPPSKSSPPGPAYSPQTFTWLGYTQYYSNLTQLHNGYNRVLSTDTKDEASVEGKPTHRGIYYGKDPHDKQLKAHPMPFEFKVEYDTRNDSIYKLKDLTIRSWLDVARRIGEYKPERENRMGVEQEDEHEDEERDISRAEEDGDIDEKLDAVQKKHKGGQRKHRKHRKRKAINKVWFTFVKRAFVGTLDDVDLHDEFGQEEDLSDETHEDTPFMIAGKL